MPLQKKKQDKIHRLRLYLNEYPVVISVRMEQDFTIILLPKKRKDLIQKTLYRTAGFVLWIIMNQRKRPIGIMMGLKVIC